ncbi:MAG: hypothetical protein N3A61_01030, partial [Ignavibacteria bacterium]|nr:hypothetical protein [Ignavibacteria bacterium]
LKIERTFILAVISLGVTSICSQIILLREFLSVFFGNELVIGVILSNWMILTGIGAYFGKYAVKIKSKFNSILFLMTLLSLLPIVTVFLLSYLRNIVFIAGSMISLIQIWYSSLILLLPLCFINGILFTLFTHTFSEKYGENILSKVYSFESLGSSIGGLVFSLIIVFYFNWYESLVLLCGVNFVVLFFFAHKYSKPYTKYLFVFLLLLLQLSNFIDLDKISRQMLFEGQEILYYKDTPYGKITSTQQNEQKNFFINNVLLFTTNDPTTIEESVHYAMIQHSNPKNVLLISNGIAVNEILKYNVDKIDYVELNPWMIQLEQKFTSDMLNPKVNIINKDARLFIKETRSKYDIILINLPDPLTAQVNRYFTLEFFKELKQKLNDDGVVSTSLISGADYLSKEAYLLNSVLFNTLKQVFENILIVPGLKNYFLASDGKLNINIAEMIQKKGIDNIYVNQYYLDDKILEERSNYILSSINKQVIPNEDFKPVAYYRQLIYWLSYFELNYWILAIGISLVLIFIIIKQNAVTFGLLTGGFSASAVQILLVISFQILYGFVYHAIGFFISIFMAGLALGAINSKFFGKKITLSNYAKVQIFLGVYSLLLPLLFTLLQKFNSYTYIIYLAFGLMTLIVSFLIGAEFAVASQLQKGNMANVASRLYSIDLVGSAFGSLLISAILIPLIGIFHCCLLVAFVNFVSATVSYLNNKKFERFL